MLSAVLHPSYQIWIRCHVFVNFKVGGAIGPSPYHPVAATFKLTEKLNRVTRHVKIFFVSKFRGTCVKYTHAFFQC